jgi:hypothetical protein
MTPPPKIREWLSWEISGKNLGRVRDKVERERLRNERWRQRVPKEPSNWQKILFKKACAAEDCSTWYVSSTKALKDAGKTDGRFFGVLFRARATVAVPRHEARILEYDLTQIQVHNPESGYWEQIWSGMFSEPVPIGKEDYPHDYVMAHKVAKRYVQAEKAEELLPLMDEVVSLHEGTLQPWIDQFPRVLAKALKDAQGLEDGWVWQDEFRDYLSHFDEKLSPKLEDLDGRLEEVWLEHNYLDDIINVVRRGTSEPEDSGRIAHAISDFSFFPHEGAGRDHIAYRVDTLKEWAKAFAKWSKDAVASTKKERRSAQQRIKRRA